MCGDACPCYKAFREETEKKVVAEGDIDDSDDDSETVNFPWTRDSESNPAENVYFEDEVPLSKHYQDYGCNLEKIKYPYSENMSNQFFERMQGETNAYNLPLRLVPELNPRYDKCSKHQNKFSSDESDLIMVSKNTIVHSVLSDKVFDVPVFARKTLATPGTRGCECLLQVDGNKWLLWHDRKGRMVDYEFLNFYLHFKVKGKGIYEAWTSRVESLGANNYESTLTYKSFQRACLGFEGRLEFPADVFVCNDCTLDCKYLVFDAKVIGPNKHKLDHLHEEDDEDDNHIEDEDTLKQSTYFKGRVFLSSAKERALVLQLVSGEIDMMSFLSSEIKSRNGNLAKDVIENIEENFLILPDEYSRLIKNICKPYSVSSLIQVTSEETLTILKKFCDRELDLLAAQNRRLLRKVQQQMPPFWDCLSQILKLENAKFLPWQLKRIVLELIAIRQNTFNSAEIRSSDDYIDWDNDWGKPPLAFYPNHPKLKILNKYIVNNTKDRELCQKAEVRSKTQASGVFSVGCLCPRAITMGFELMKNAESPRNLFRFLMTRDVPLDPAMENCLQGVVYDNACTLSKYLLNREANKFQFLRVLVDGMHWTGHRRTRGETEFWRNWLKQLDLDKDKD